MLFLSAHALGLAALAVDPAHVAVYDTCASQVEVEAAVAVEGLGSVRPWAIPGWWLVDVPAEPVDVAATSVVIDHLARAGRVAFVSPVYVGLDGGPAFPTTDLLVQFARGTRVDVESTVLNELRGFEVVETRFGAMDDTFRLRTTSRDARDVIAAARELERRSDVVFAEPDSVFTGHGDVQATIQLPPNDALFPVSWWLSNTGQSGGVVGVDCDALEAWPRTIGQPTAVVAVIDTGVEIAHPDLVANMILGADVTTDGPGVGNPVNVFDSHGTPVAGCIVAAIDNGIGSCGLAPGCRAVSVRTFITIATDGSWTAQLSWTVNALAQAAALGARVTNNSNFYGITSAAIDQKYLDTRNAGIVHFASAGNGAVNVIDYPASLPTVNAVGAIDRTGAHATFSNTGSGLAFVGPGDTIATTDRQGAAGWTTSDYTYANGTSFSTPMAAAIAAMLVATDPTLSPAQIEASIRNSCIDLGPPGYDTVFGWGLVSAVRALDQLCLSPFNYCASSPNSFGPGAVMSYSGVPTSELNALTLIVTGCPPNGFGVFFLGDASTQVPFGNGFRCTAGSVYRFGVTSTNAFGDAEITPAWGSLPPAFQVVPGDVRYAQFWYRDAFASGPMFNLSDGLEIHFCR